MSIYMYHDRVTVVTEMLNIWIEKKNMGMFCRLIRFTVGDWVRSANIQKDSGVGPLHCCI